MFTGHHQDSAPLSSPTDQIRRLLQQSLRTDSLLDAFCIDYFPEVYRHFASGMDRTQKLNLLLLIAPPEAIVEGLGRLTPLVIEKELPPPVPRRSRERSPRSSRLRNCALGSFVIAFPLLAVIGTRVARVRSPHEREAQVALVAERPIGPPVLPSLPSGNDSVPWLTSEPPGALVVEASTGRVLGQTPWSAQEVASVFRTSARRLQVCLRRAGFVPMLVTLEPGVEPFRPIQVQLQRGPRAAVQRDLGQEDCNAPTPIIP